MFEQEILIYLIGCTQKDIDNFKKFIEDFKIKYNEDISQKFLIIFKHNLDYLGSDDLVGYIWNCLFELIFKRYIPKDEEYVTDVIYDLRRNTLKKDFRFLRSDFKFYVEDGINQELVDKLINDLNWFLERRG